MEATGQAAIDMILAQRPDRVTLYADRRLDASALVRIVNSITSHGTIAVDLVLAPQGGSDE
jgi:biopolymer transport protein ExbD